MSKGPETQGLDQYRKDNGFYDKYMQGSGLDIGYKGTHEGKVDPVLPTATGIDLNYPGYDGLNLPFDSNSQDYVFSSHCLEHIDDQLKTITEWFRVLKVKGHLIIIVPHQYLYEKRKQLPSKWNRDHKRFYTPGYLLSCVEMALKPNSYRVRLLEDGDKGFDYNLGPDKHSGGQYEIVLVLEKIKEVKWELE